MGNTIILVPSGGVPSSVSGGTSANNAKPVTLDVAQLLGFIPMSDCDASECRVFNGNCYINPVFGTINAISSTYENDYSTFFFYDSLHRLYEWVLQKKDEHYNTWSDVATMGNTYGTKYNYNYFGSTHPYYFGFQLNWGAVLTLQGAGIYRVKLKTTLVYEQRNPKKKYCKVSEPFRLLPFNCNVADVTVRFETTNTGNMGSHLSNGDVFDLCNMTLYDSIRLPGFFGHKKGSYSETILEYQTGLIDVVRDETVLKYNYQSRLLPQYIHDRFMVYGMMANALYVSDYNRSNSDYNIKQFRIHKAGNYEPVPNKANRLTFVSVDFVAGIQSIIKSTSCDKIK